MSAEAVAVLIAQTIVVVAALWSLWIVGRWASARLRQRKEAEAPKAVARVGDLVSVVAQAPAQQAAPPPASIPEGRCKCCRAKPATHARPYSTVPWRDTVELLNRSARLHSMPRRWIVKRPHVSSDHPAEYCQGCEALAVSYLENGHAGFRADNQRSVQKQDRQCEVLNAGMDAELDRHEQDVAADVAAMQGARAPQDSSPQLVIPVTQTTQVVG